MDLNVGTFGRVITIVTGSAEWTPQPYRSTFLYCTETCLVSYLSVISSGHAKALIVLCPTAIGFVAVLCFDLEICFDSFKWVHKAVITWQKLSCVSSDWNNQGITTIGKLLHQDNRFTWWCADLKPVVRMSSRATSPSQQIVTAVISWSTICFCDIGQIVIAKLYQRTLSTD